MTVIAIVQARMGSTRLPGKVLKNINGRPLIEILLERLSQSRLLDSIVLATSTSALDDELADAVNRLGYDVSRGSEHDVLARYYDAARSYSATTIVRVTGDCPLIDPQIVDQLITLFEDTDVDYASNINPPTYPDGLDIEVFTFSALENAHKESTIPYDREHVTPFIRKNDQLIKKNLAHIDDMSDERWTVDEASDLDVVRNIINHFSPDTTFTLQDILGLTEIHPEYFLANKHLSRNYHTVTGTGQELWHRAKNIIPGGNMLLSKRAEMFLPERWPTYFSKTNGCHVWDLDGKRYTDMSVMGIGTNILGYNHPEVDESVRNVVAQGNMSTLNCPEEVYLAERLVELHPWAQMVRFARSGGEANAIAIRIARAASGKAKVAICGYHGWHDWYLATNLGNQTNLDEHHLPGLNPSGVPHGLANTILPFRYNDYEMLETLVNNNKDLGIIKMEVQRSEKPKPDFLEKVRALATKNNIVLIFDECTSGFREALGGLHKKYSVEPDMAVFGKALGNGYAITAIVGKATIMQAAQNSFISSTFWTERIGSCAALSTLRVMENTKSWEVITRAGEEISQGWIKLSEKYGLSLDIKGLPSLTSFTIPTPDWLKYKTLITQEMLSKEILATNSVYACTAHTPALINEYLVKLDPVFSLIRDCQDGRSIDDLLHTPICHAGFNRLN